MRMRSRSVAVPSAAHNNNNHHNLNNNNSSHVGSAATTGASRSVLNIPGELKLHYSEVVSVAEKLSRLFSRTHTYHVHRRHKTLRQEPSNSWVTVHNLKQLDGGILDPDDRLNDVADDREQIIAIYDEQTHHHHHHGGDGTSASSDSENPSPDIFQGVEHKFAPFTRNDIEITGEELSATPPPLHVRRGSEPALNRLSPIPPAAAAPPDPTKRWSAAPIIEDQNAPPSSTPMKMVIPHLYVQDGHSSYEDDNVFVDPGERGEGSGEEKTPSSSSSSSHHSATTAFTRFSRDTNRCSVQVLSDNPAMARWADAADRVVGTSEGRRREPLGGSASSPMHSRDPSHDEAANSILVVLSNDRGPLGIHVIPSTDVTGHDQGLLVEGVEPGGRIARDGRIEVHDRIIEINGKPLNNITFQKAQEIFKDAMLTPELRLRVVKGQRQEWYAGQAAELVEGEEKLVGGAKVASVMSTRKVPPASLSSRTQTVILQSNTRKIGRRLNVHLTKGQHGLGFSITTRDNPAGGEAPIYIKNILPKGAAIEDGNLRIGDRLLEVNGVEVTGRSQSEVAALLREIPIGGAATLAVSRQDQRNGEAASGTADSTPETEKPASPKLPRQLVSYHHQDSLPFLRQPAEKAAEDSLMFPWKQREILMFEIPVHDSERAGLGVSVKGKTSSGPNGSVDLGIFVKNVIHGGAASRDGRLFQNDQLVNINGMSLLGKPNSEAMKTLRTAMHQEGPTPGIISLTVARRIDHKERSSPSSNNRSGRESANSLLTNSSGTETLGGAKSSPATPTPDHSGTTDTSDTTVIFNDHKYDGDGHEIDASDFGHINPVIQRLTGNNGALRNESYYKATHDTWNTSQLQQLVMRGERESVAVGGPSHNPLGSPTVNLPSRDTLIIHDDAGNHMSREICRSDGPGASAGSYSDHPSQSDDAYTSQTSLEENAAGFSRDQFGRQSMSEKRHATLDAKNTDTYQRNKKAREEREKQRQMMLAQEKLAASQGMGMGLAAMEAARNRELLSRDAAVMGGKLLVRASSDESLASQNLQRTNSHAHEQPSSSSSQHEHLPPQDALRSRLDVGPGLGMKKSSSLESLQTMVQEMALEEEGHRMGSGRVPRGRGCNESFRAAVDRSYDVPLTGLRNKMETQDFFSHEEYFGYLVAEEESESSGSGFGRGNSRQSSVNSAVDDKYKKVGKKKPGIFKGLGSMFRFGKHRKSIDNPNGLTSKGDGEADRSEGRTEVDRAEVERLAAARRLQQEEHDRMQEQYRRMIENTARSSQQQQQPQMRPDEGEPSRSERMHQLRAEHQRRHAQRNRTYPTDDLEERYESAIKQGHRQAKSYPAPRSHRRSQSQDLIVERRALSRTERLDPVPSEPKPDIRHMRSHSYDLYGDNGGRPGSRTAYADPHKYSHYVNYEQIQQHLRKNKEQERLKKLASQQYQDFREKQTRRQQESSPTTLLHKLEETFIHESIIASREAREYQSQRGPRDSAREHQHRPVSNYYEYESVQAMISHAQDNSSTSLPRRHHPPPPGPPPVAAAAVAKNASNNNASHNNNLFPGVSQPHHMMMYKQISGSSVHSTHSAHGGQMGNYGQTMSNMGHRGHNEHSRDMPHQEGLYGSSYRPASHYTGPHHKPPPPPPHHHTTTLTVPGSKV
ncbi:partitioning defective 3 homolog isoform X15 [Penaeus monodon]|uniref:partitioning defective 3 homolog isoform X15 n=1 Tax=Penaeus monodon TaxID=6687 RepID=UPI0018A6D643|nr:partitioning defective 3 homolog isoform X15 [Penaeus monodon]